MYASEGRWKLARHHAFLNRKLMEVAAGRCPRLIVEMPPQHGKSQLTSQYGTAWYLGNLPDRRVILSSYEAGFAAYWGRKARDLLEAHGPEVFGIKVSDKSSAADHWEITGHQGMMNTAGVMGPVTGKSADWFIIDDPIKNPEEAKSALIREKIWEWFDDVAMTRLQPGAAVTVIMTRWHKDDLAGRLERQGGWEVIKLPAIAGPNDPLGRAVGEGLWLDHFGQEYYAKVRAESSPYKWASLYQQDPTEEGGNVIKRDWLQEYTTLPACDLIIQSWDTAFKTGSQNDFSVCGTFGATRNGYYLLDLWRGRVAFPELKRAAVSLYAKWNPVVVLIEDKASGQSLCQELERDTSMPIKPIKVDSDKVARLNAVSPLMESGRYYLPAPELIMPDGSHLKVPWLADYIEEVVNFPNAANDDQVDMTSQGLSYLKAHGVGKAASIEQATAPGRSAIPTYSRRR